MTFQDDVLLVDDVLHDTDDSTHFDDIPLTAEEIAEIGASADSGLLEAE